MYSRKVLFSALLEKIIFVQLVKKFLAFYGIRRIVSAFMTDRHWSLA
jgi:hypothetical protein